MSGKCQDSVAEVLFINRQKFIPASKSNNKVPAIHGKSCTERTDVTQFSRKFLFVVNTLIKNLEVLITLVVHCTCALSIKSSQFTNLNQI